MPELRNRNFLKIGVKMIVQYNDKKPKIAKNTFIAENAVIIGDVTIEEDVSIWYGVVLRGDIAPIYIGKGTNIQDNTVIHVDNDTPCVIKDYVTVGHNAIIHAATIEKDYLIGIRATLLTGSRVKAHSIIGANALVTEKKEIPEGTLAVGMPAKVVRNLTGEEKKFIKENALHYVENAKEYKK